MKKDVHVYSTPTCHYCNMAKEYFKAQGVEFVNYNVAEDAEKREEMLEKTGQMGVPVIQIGDDIVIGFNKPVIDQLLGISA